MGKSTALSFCKFGTFVFLFYFAEVLSVPTLNIIDVMKNDSKLCNMPTFLYENDITKICSQLEYPKENIQADYSFANTFLCLAFYDTWYKVCQFHQLQKPFNDTATFTSYIQKFFPEEKEAATFCKSVKGVTFSYAKLQPLLSLVNFNSSRVCDSTCFNMQEKFNPLCAILSWSISIDDSRNKLKSSHDKVNDEAGQQNQLKPPIINSNKQGSAKEGSLKNDNNTNVNKNSLNTSQKSAVQKSSVEPSAETKPILSYITTKVQETEKQKPASNAESTVPNQQKDVSTNAEADHASLAKTFEGSNDNTDKEVLKMISEDTNINAESEGKKVDKNDNDNTRTGDTKTVNNNVKTSTISQNTQDHDNFANQDDWNHSDDDKQPYEPNEGPDQSIDIADQNQNMPEPSEQRDIMSRFHNMRSDEESHFFTYFTVVSLISIAAYIGYHNKQKILAIVLEGRRSRNSRGRRRPSTANYRKLDCTLEEAVTSQCCQKTKIEM
ncbi:uncharacterized protein LOC143181783 isoform X2 [Calliopsis andreniformis]|uniref:uncharacterized protein LOC143181783 isoform X2 n=1 Tax=Calliopsis andreniformis TaxID=337506 RepID=UPI003FCD2EBC